MEQTETGTTLGLLFKQIANAFECNLQREAARYDLTAAQASILIYLDRADHPVNQRELEHYFRLSNPTVTGLMKRMETKGFIRREISMEDSRSKHILLTEKATEISNEVRAHLGRVEQTIVQSMSPAECEQLRGLLIRVLKVMCRCAAEQKTEL